MKNLFNLFIISCLFVCSFSLLKANDELTIESKIDTNNLLIGDQFRYRFSATFGNEVKFEFPKFKDKIGNLEIVATNKIDTIKTTKYTTLMQSYILTAFDSGSYVIPPIEIIYDRKGFTDPYIAKADSIIIKYKTLKVDTTQAFKDIKPPLGVAFSIWDYWYWFVIAIILAIGGYYGYKYWKNKLPKEIVFEKSDPKIPPHILALEGLKKLDNEKLWQNGQIKKYYIELTNIVRLYIERTSNIPALEMTSDEIYLSLYRANFSEELINNLRFIFQLGDLAKFAKQEPLATENKLTMDNAFNFVIKANEFYEQIQLDLERRNNQTNKA